METLFSIFEIESITIKLFKDVLHLPIGLNRTFFTTQLITAAISYPNARIPP